MNDKSKTMERMKGLDGAGIVCSILCAVHCVSAPLLTLLFSLNSFSGSEYIHVSSLVGVCIISYFSFFRRGSFKRKPTLFAILGLTFLVGGFILEEQLHHAFESAEIAVNLIGCGFMVLAHWKNIEELNA
jgi:hypothetical protein